MGFYTSLSAPSRAGLKHGFYWQVKTSKLVAYFSLNLTFYIFLIFSNFLLILNFSTDFRILRSDNHIPGYNKKNFVNRNVFYFSQFFQK